MPPHLDGDRFLKAITTLPARPHLRLAEDGRLDEALFPDGRDPGDVRKAWRGAVFPGACIVKHVPTGKADAHDESKADDEKTALKAVHVRGAGNMKLGICATLDPDLERLCAACWPGPTVVFIGCFLCV